MPKLAALLLAIAACAGPRRWTPAQIALEGAFAVTMVADYNQTVTGMGYYDARWCAATGREGCGERNPIMGPQGERVAPEIYFPLVLLVHAAIAQALPGRWREAFQGATLAVSAGNVGGNWHRGYDLLGGFTAGRR